MNSVAERLKSVRAALDAACIKAGRAPEEVKILLATKTVEPEVIKQAFIYPVNYTGENKVQELSRKCPVLKDDPVQFHFIGHLQTNKVKEALKHAACIQSVDRLSLVEALDRQLQKEGRSVDVLMQVNTSYESSKFGVTPENSLTLAKEISKYGTLKLKGLMTIGLFSAEAEQVRKCFSLLRVLKDRIAALGLPGVLMEELSMGMSGDFETAIGEGATIVRIGTAIFGQRMYPDSYYWNEQKQAP